MSYRPFLAVLVAAVAGGWSAQPAQATLISAGIQFSSGDAGQANDRPLVGDWNGGGVDTIALYRDQQVPLFARKFKNDESAATTTQGGTPGDVPVVGRWNAQLANDVPAAWRPSEQNLYFPPNGSGGLDAVVHIDLYADGVPIVGDWNGDGIDSIGIFSPSKREAYVSDSTASPSWRLFAAGIGDPGDQPVIGDWEGDGRDTLAVFRASSTAAGTYFYTTPNAPQYGGGTTFGNPGDKPVVGDFDGDGDTDLGIFRPSEQRFYLETGTFNPPAPAATPAPTPTPGPSATPKPGSPGTVPGVTTPGTAGTVGQPNGTGGNPATGKVTGVVAPKAAIRFKKPLALTGKVVDAAGTPLAGAFVDVFTTVAVPGAPRVFAGTIAADATGGFKYAVSTRASQTVEFTYAAKQASADYVDQAKVDVAVQASVSFALPKKASRGKLVKFSGVVGVDPLPKKGARVVIELRDGKRWRTTRNVRTSAGGVFTWNYRFKTRGSFTFRARLLSAVDVPAKRNQSVARKVTIR